MSAFVRSTKATQYKDGRNDLYEKVIHIVLLSCYVLQQHRVYLLLEWNQNECGVKNMPTTASSRWKVGWTFFFTIKGIYKDRKKLEKDRNADVLSRRLHFQPTLTLPRLNISTHCEWPWPHLVIKKEITEEYKCNSFIYASISCCFIL